MAKKIKLNEAANDFHVSTQDIIQLFADKGDLKKKNTSTLSNDEVNFLLEHFSKENQVENFDAYFNSVNQKRPEIIEEDLPKSKSKTNTSKPKKKSETVKKEVVSSPAPKSEPKKVEEVAPAPKSNANAENSAPKVNKLSEKEDMPMQKQNNNKANSNKFNKTNNNANANKPSNNNTKPNNNAVKPNANNNNNNAVKPNNNNNNANAKKPMAKKQEHGEKTKLNAGISSETTETAVKRRTVDTRGTYVDLDKYNERYEQIAPAHKHKDNYSTKKQKINQKSAQRGKMQYTRKESDADKLKRIELERARKQQITVLIPDSITVGELASRLKKTAPEVIKKLIGYGIMATINQEIDYDTATLVAEELGAKVEKEVIVTIEERLLIDDDVAENEADLVDRSPVVVVMGHVDHGKTSILDRIRNANVTASEAGGITQHIGAYQVRYNDKRVTFLDTPGHEAFTSMRARGANITDIAILVVAADDGIMPQTVESINHAKAAGIQVIVAINKMDKEGANPDRVRQELTEHGLVCEEWGGDVMCIPVSAKTGEGINDLLENILLISEINEYKANPNRLAKGTVIEARLDKGRGPIATLLVQKGTLKSGDVIIAGTAVGRIRVMTNDKGKVVKNAGPSVPVEITGLAEVPSAGDIFNAVENERLARTLVEQRRHDAKEEQFNAIQKVTLDNLFNHIAEGEMKELPIIVKADVQGSVEAVKQSLEKISNEEVRVRVIHGGVGAVKESDVMLANASNAIIVGFNVRPDPVAAESAVRDGVDIRLYRIIYDAIEEMQTAMKGMLAPKFRDVEMARIEVRQVYKITNVGAVAGCYVLDGKVSRHCQIRVVRDGIIIADDKVDGLKRFKDDVKDVAAGYECGVTLEKFSDVKEGDIFEAYIVEEYKED